MAQSGANARPPSLVLFGPQVAFQSSNRYLKWVRTALLDSPDIFQRLQSAVAQLPLTWTKLVTAEACFARLDGLRHLDLLRSWIDSGRLDVESDDLPTVLLAPLTVIAHVAEYYFMRRTSASNGLPTTNGASQHDGPCQGFCIGFLVAAVYSCARDEAHEHELIGKALNISLVVGATIDLQRLNNSVPWSCVVTQWKSEEAERHLYDVLEDAPSAYISCRTDVNEATVTLPRTHITHLTSRLSMQHIAVHRIGVVGRFHHLANQKLVARIREHCDQNPDLQLPGSDELTSPLRSNVDGGLIAGGSLTHLALEAILVKPCLWYETVAQSVADTNLSSRRVIVIGGVDVLPKSIAAERALEPVLPSRLIVPASGRASVQRDSPDLTQHIANTGPNESVAVIGVSCRFPGADSPDDFWQLIKNAKSMVQAVSTDRFAATSQTRTPENMGTNYWGNFVKHMASFDNAFFRVSPREAQSIDPQQRLILQLAYEALQTSGYFVPTSSARDTNVGTYVGVTTDDYRDNIFSHESTPFSAIGSLRAFITGRLNHFFGWDGPAITYDTACSSSAVALHAACQALLLDECTTAIAGGVNTTSSPATWQNLAAGRFLSPTGACKPFDAAADGYCRGEGAGLVVLKKLSAAVADGDPILAVIEASAVNQCRGSPSITVPSGLSQGQLYEKLLKKACGAAEDVTYVEAHGTGTPVGDPIELNCIREVFRRRSPADSTPLSIGSVKANIGHTESASGIAAVIKTVLMIQHRKIPPLANFQKLNPSIPPLESDGITIPTRLVPWDVPVRKACVNNYGAAGSNAAILISEYRQSDRVKAPSKVNGTHSNPKHLPILLTAKTSQSLQMYREALTATLSDRDASLHLPSFAFHSTRQQNHSHPYRLAFNVARVEQLREELRDSTPPETKSDVVQKRAPVVLVFGGQTNDRAYISADLVRSCTLLQSRLDLCQKLCSEMGLPDIFPGVLQDKPHDDLVQLHCILFSMQYACATSWIESGLVVDAIVGHSFGQLTALCVAGVLSLRDALRLVSGRAALIKRFCDPAKGVMLAVELLESDGASVGRLLQEAADCGIDVACVNGPSSFVFSGTSATKASFLHRIQCSGLRTRTKELGVTHAYHSRLMDSVAPELHQLAGALDFKRPQIELELTTEHKSSNLDAHMVVSHLREPVNFYNAVKRISGRLESAIWLEAGSGSPVISIVRRCLEGTDSRLLLPLNISNSTSSSKELAEVTCQLWKARVPVNYWNYHALQSRQYHWVDLPPYQFSKDKHWLEYREPDSRLTATNMTSALVPENAPLVSLLHWSTPETVAVFAVNTRHATFRDMASGHRILDKPIAPASLYLEMAAHAVYSVSGSSPDGSQAIGFSELEMMAPLTLNHEGAIELVLNKVDASSLQWRFEFGSSGPQGRHVQYASGIVRASSAAADFDVSQEEPPLSYDDIVSAMNGPETESVQGAVLYRLFSTVANYTQQYQAMKAVAALGNDIFSRISRRESSTGGMCDAYALDYFVQPVGFVLNCLQEIADEDLFICTKQDELNVRASQSGTGRLSEWLVHARLMQEVSKHRTYNVFVYDARRRLLVASLAGVRFDRTPRRQLSRLLGVEPSAKLEGQQPLRRDSTSAQRRQSIRTLDAESRVMEHGPLVAAKMLLSNATGINAHNIPDEGELIDLGVDSLVSMDLESGIHKACGARVSTTDLFNMTTVSSLAAYLAAHSGIESVGNLRIDRPSPEQREQHEVGAGARVLTHHDEVHTNGIASSVSFSHSCVHQPLTEAFMALKTDFDSLCRQSAFAGFYDSVHPLQEQLVCLYIVDAFKRLGCDLRTLQPGSDVRLEKFDPKHGRLVQQLFRILEVACLVHTAEAGRAVRTDVPVPEQSCDALLGTLREARPKYRMELDLLARVGAALPACLTGFTSPIEILFRDETTRMLLEQVYRDGPMHATASMFLQRLMQKVTEHLPKESKPLQILEVGAGTGATTTWVADALAKSQVDWQYTFTDVSASLVANARRKYSGDRNMTFSVLDIEAEPPVSMQSCFDIVISTNCIHATADLAKSLTHVREMLYPDGVLLLVEFTRNLSWFDLVFGLLDGWWAAQDGRDHPLVDEHVWEKAMRRAGFEWTSCTEGLTEESKLLRVLAASTVAPAIPEHVAASNDAEPQAVGLVRRQTVVYQTVDGLDLLADIHFPVSPDSPGRKRPILLLVHGGGHVLLSRHDVPPHHIVRAHKHGLLPVTIDYRLAPEVPLHLGAMVDTLSALRWLRSSLSHVDLVRTDMVPDTSRVLALGISTGGQLALSLGWTARAAGIEPPSAVCALYAPSDYHDAFWSSPNYPAGTTDASAERWASSDMCEGVATQPIASYRVAREAGARDGWAAEEDARARIVLGMNWWGRTVEVLVRGADAVPTMNTPAEGEDVMVSEEEVSRISPLAQIESGRYQTPTVLVHGSADDVVPIAQSRRTALALSRADVDINLVELPGAVHLFDLKEKGLSEYEGAFEEAIEWMCERL